MEIIKSIKYDMMGDGDKFDLLDVIEELEEMLKKLYVNKEERYILEKVYITLELYKT